MRALSDVSAIVNEVASIVRQITSDSSLQVRLFGSWASGNARPHSDVDIAIDGPQRVDPVHMFDIRDACDRLPTLLTIDLVDLAATPPAFREAVRSQWEKTATL